MVAVVVVVEVYFVYMEMLQWKNKNRKAGKIMMKEEKRRLILQGGVDLMFVPTGKKMKRKMGWKKKKN
jgi:uncharacterized membrane protein